VLVTGANRGIGRAFVTALPARGAATIYAAARDTSGLADIGPDERIVPLTSDITHQADIDAAARQVDHLDLLINNAGSLTPVDLLAGDVALIEREMQVNCLGTLRVTRAFLPRLEASGGAIVNVLTVVALASMPPMAAYSASKAAAYSMTQAVRALLSARGVVVHGVFPGAVDTDMIRNIDMPQTSPAAVAQAVLTSVECGELDIFPDPMARQLQKLWQSTPRALEATLAGLSAAA
jgi:NAD(P)-dependent dehydrogenase (short-subunit alcohol dehydrogenase family)